MYCNLFSISILKDGHLLAISASIMFQNIGNNVEQYMNVLSYRQKLVASNIANADTPNYKTKDVDFQAEFRKAINSGATATAIEVKELPAKQDGNNVSLDREARLLAENAIRFNLATSLMKGEFKQIRAAIQDGRSA